MPVFWYTKISFSRLSQYIAKYGTLDHPTELNQHKCLVYKGFEGPNRWLVRKPMKNGYIIQLPRYFLQTMPRV